jgi:hypothetical protein
MATASEKFESWAIVELLGHVRIAGRVTEEERFGVKLGRIDVPRGEGFYTQYFGGGSVYRLSPTTEEIARAVAASSMSEPVHRYELALPSNRPDPLENADFEEVHDEDE